MPASNDLPSGVAAMDAKVRATCAMLESVAMQYARDSAEHEAIREAALAFIYLQTHETLKAAYVQYREHTGGPMAEEKLEILRRAGVEVD